MNAFRTSLVVATALTIGVGIGRSEVVVSTERVVPSERVAESVAVRHLTVDGDAISGVVSNRSGKVLRDVQLLIRYDWRWKNEFRPGADNPGRAVFYTVPGEIPPDGQTTFTYRLDRPLPERSDGRFDTSVEVVSFVEVTS